MIEFIERKKENRSIDNILQSYDVYPLDSIINDRIKYALDQDHFAIFVGQTIIRMTIPEMPAVAVVVEKMNETNNRNDHKQSYRLSQEIMDIYNDVKDLKRMDRNYWINGKKDYGENEEATV